MNSVNLVDLETKEHSGDSDDDYEYNEQTGNPSDSEYEPESNVIEIVTKPIQAKPIVRDENVRIDRSPQKKKGRPKKKSRQSKSSKLHMQCEHCNMIVIGKNNLKAHIKRVHLKERDHPCKICGKAFWCKSILEGHMLAVHTRKCESCKEYVVEAVPWAEGINMKTVRDVICECGSIVSIYSVFGKPKTNEPNRKMKEQNIDDDENSKSTSLKGKTIACGVCDRLFNSESYYKKHAARHMEDKLNMKPCLCDLCGTSFSYKGSLKRHMKKKHGIIISDSIHECHKCGERYSNEASLKSHIKAHHTNRVFDQECNNVSSPSDQEADSLQTDEVHLSIKQIYTSDDDDDDDENSSTEVPLIAQELDMGKSGYQEIIKQLSK